MGASSPIYPRRAAAFVTVLFLSGLGSASAFAGTSPPAAEAALKEAKQQAALAVRGDKRAKDLAEKALNRAKDLFEKSAKNDRSCQTCVEGLAATQFLESFIGLDKTYKDCIEIATEGLKQFPTSSLLAYYAGSSHFAEKEYGDAARQLNRFILSSSGEPEAENQARDMLEQSRKLFLADWYGQKDFYQSNDSRVSRYNPTTKQNELLLQVTPEYETNLAQQAFTQITGSARPIQDPELQSYLEDLVNRLVDKSPGPGFRYRVTVIDSPEVNAVTPPGHIIVYRGLIGFAETEAELAGVLAHELAHNYGHHSARALIKAYHTQAVAGAVASLFNKAVKPQNELIAMLPGLVAQLGAGLYIRAYSRSEEKEADLYGSHILFNAGYSPTALSMFFTKLYARNPKQPMKLLSTHPPLPDRADYLIDYSDSFPLDREMKADSEAFQKLRARIAPEAQQPAPKTNTLPALPFNH